MYQEQRNEEYVAAQFSVARLGETKDDGKCKPALLKFYDFRKGGTDIIYQCMGIFSVNISPNDGRSALFLTYWTQFL